VAIRYQVKMSLCDMASSKPQSVARFRSTVPSNDQRRTGIWLRHQGRSLGRASNSAPTTMSIPDSGDKSAISLADISRGFRGLAAVATSASQCARRNGFSYARPSEPWGLRRSRRPVFVSGREARVSSPGRRRAGATREEPAHRLGSQRPNPTTSKAWTNHPTRRRAAATRR
jgi:hypothetical protein